MTDRRYVAPMPPQLRTQLHTGHHPARTAPCPHCKAAINRPCTLRKSGRPLPDPHWVRVTEWARATACCPECQVEPGVPCHDEGTPRTTVHNRRKQEAEETSA